MRRAAAFTIPLLLVVVLVGRHGSTTTAQAAVRHALARTVDAKSSRFTLSWTSPDLPAQLPVENKIEGLMDYTRHRGRISYFGDGEVILDGDVTYMKWSLPWRKESPWLRMDNSEQDPLDLQERLVSNPIGLLEFLTGAGRDVRQVASEQVRGTRTIHYEGTLDLQRVVDQAPAGKRAELQELLDFMRENEPTTVPFGLWVDRDGIAHRLRLDQNAGSSLLVDYYDFGIPVEITPPAPSEIISIVDYMKELSEHAESDCGETEPGSAETTDAASGDFSPGSESAHSDLPETHIVEDGATIGSGTTYLCAFPTDDRG